MSFWSWLTGGRKQQRYAREFELEQERQRLLHDRRLAESEVLKREVRLTEIQRRLQRRESHGR